MAIAGRHLGEPEWIASAERALDFIHGTLWQNGRLLATYKDGRAHLNAYLDDYVYLIDAILEQPGTRLPGTRRLALRAAAARDGVVVPDALYDELKALSAN